MKITRLEIGANIRKLLVEILKNPDVTKEIKEQIAKATLDFLLPKYLVSKKKQLNIIY